MTRKIKLVLLYLAISSFFLLPKTKAQSILSGRIFDSDIRRPLEFVSIQNQKTEKGDLTDRTGFYTLKANLGDTIKISLIGYFTIKYVCDIVGKDFTKDFYLSIQEFELQSVKVILRKSNYYDPIKYRNDYKDIFEFKNRKTILASVAGIISHPQGILYLMDMHGDRSRDKRMEKFRNHLTAVELYKYVDSRYNKELIKITTGLSGDSLNYFFAHFRPEYNQVRESSDYVLMEFIKKQADYYRTHKEIMTP